MINRKFIALLRGQFVSQHVALCFVRGVLEMLPGGHFATWSRGLTSRTWSRDPTIEPLAAVLLNGWLTALEHGKIEQVSRNVQKSFKDPEVDQGMKWWKHKNCTKSRRLQNGKMDNCCSFPRTLAWQANASHYKCVVHPYWGLMAMPIGCRDLSPVI